MAVIGNKRVIDLLYDNDLLAPSYSKEKALSDLNSHFMGVLSEFEEEKLNQLIVLLPEITQAKISNYSDLISFLSSTPEELSIRKNVYRSFGENLKLKTVKDIATNPAFIATKLNYCKMFEYPYCSDDGQIYEEVSQDSILSKSYLKRFYTIYFEKYFKKYFGKSDESKDKEYNYILEGIENDPLSELFSKIQNTSQRLYGRFVEMTDEFEESMKITLQTNGELINQNDLLRAAFSKLRDNNSFINQEDILLIKNHDSREDFRGQR